MPLCFRLCVWYDWVKYKKVVGCSDQIFHVGSKFWCNAKVQDGSSWYTKYIFLEINKILFCVMLQLHSNYSKQQMEIRTSQAISSEVNYFCVVCLLCTSSINWLEVTSHQKPDQVCFQRDWVHALHGSQSVGCVSSQRENEHIKLKSRTQGQLKYSEVENKTCMRTGLKSYHLLPQDKSDNI